MSERKPYTTDISDEEQAFVAPYQTLMTETASQRDFALREVFNGLRWVIECSFGWTARFRRLARGCECMSETLKGLHFLAFAMLMAQISAIYDQPEVSQSLYTLNGIAD